MRAFGLRQRRRSHNGSRSPRRGRRGMASWKAGLLLLVVLAVVGWFGLTKDIPFTKEFELRAVVTDAVRIRAGSPVRIAGVNIGKIKQVEPYALAGQPNRASLLTMQIEADGLPITKDATFKIRARVFLEGNWFIDLQPGSPGAEQLKSGDVLPITAASGPVQFDQFLTALQSDDRKGLQDLLDGLGTALTYRPSATDDREQDRLVRGMSGAQALRRSLDDAPSALRQSTLVAQALLGENEHDLSRLMASTARVTGALARDDRALTELVTNLGDTFGSFAAERESVDRALQRLPQTVRRSRAALKATDDALPNVRALALELVPAMKETPATIDASYPWIDQARALMSGRELGGLVDSLTPATRSLAKLTDANVQALPQADLFAQCLADYVLPLGDIRVDDGHLSTGVENYKEFWYGVVGLAGEAQNFDGNGNYIRFQLGGGGYAWMTGPVGPSGGSNVNWRNAVRSNLPPLGTRPAYPGRKPPLVADRPCKDQALPGVNSHPTGPADGSGRGGQPVAPYVPLQSSTLSLAAKSGRDGDLVGKLLRQLDPFGTGPERGPKSESGRSGR